MKLKDYFLVRNDRMSLKASVITASQGVFSNSPEYLMIEIRYPNSDSLLFTSMNRRPKGLLFHEFINVFSQFSHAYKNIIIAGDLNYNLLSDNFEAG